MGLIENRPNSRNVVPGAVFFTIDLRHPDDEVVQDMQEEFYDYLQIVSDDHIKAAWTMYKDGKKLDTATLDLKRKKS